MSAVTRSDASASGLRPSAGGDGFLRLSAAWVLVLSAGAAAETLDGRWVTPLGTLAITEKGDAVEGSLERPAVGCPLKAGASVLQAEVLEDSVSGKLLLCLAGCDKGSDWVPALLLLSGDGQRLSGALTLPKGCRPAVETPSAFVAQRAGAAAPVEAPAKPRHRTPAAPPPAATPTPTETATPTRTSDEPEVAVSVRPVPPDWARKKAHELAQDGAQYLGEGRFERARERFKQAVAIDASYAEGYNGIGATYRARNDLAEALRWYKRSVQADPTIGDAYYNMACVYALLHKRALALRYLEIARKNGYVTGETMKRDEDLAALRGDPAYQALLGGE